MHARDEISQLESTHVIVSKFRIYLSTFAEVDSRSSIPSMPSSLLRSQHHHFLSGYGESFSSSVPCIDGDCERLLQPPSITTSAQALAIEPLPQESCFPSIIEDTLQISTLRRALLGLADSPLVGPNTASSKSHPWTSVNHRSIRGPWSLSTKHAGELVHSPELVFRTPFCTPAPTRSPTHCSLCNPSPFPREVYMMVHTANMGDRSTLWSTATTSSHCQTTNRCTKEAWSTAM